MTQAAFLTIGHAGTRFSKLVNCLFFASSIAAALTALAFFKLAFMGTFAHTFLVFAFCLWVMGPLTLVMAAYVWGAKKATHSQPEVQPSLASIFARPIGLAYAALCAFSLTLVAGVYVGDTLYDRGVRQAGAAAPALMQAIHSHHKQTGQWPAVENRLPAIAASKNLPLLASMVLIYGTHESPPQGASMLAVYLPGAMMLDKEVSADGVNWVRERF